MNQIRFIYNDDIHYVDLEIPRGYDFLRYKGKTKVRLKPREHSEILESFINDNSIDFKYATLIMKEYKGIKNAYINLKGITKEVEEELENFKLDEDEVYCNSVTKMGDSDIAALKVEDMLGI